MCVKCVNKKSSDNEQWSDLTNNFFKEPNTASGVTPPDWQFGHTEKVPP